VGIWEDRVVPRIVDLALAGERFTRMRQRACAGLRGEVVEIGFGSGRNAPHYPEGTARVRAVEPSAAGMRLAAGRIAAARVPIELVGLDGEHLPFDDASIDHVLTTWTLCTIPDVERALGEVARVLRPGGALHFVEHGRAPDERVARWQDRLTPLQRRVAGGCHLNRPIDRLIEGAGLTLTSLETGYALAPKAFGYTYEGVATKR
jgi:ubiquinone/menaquinone biosynthesis C-methylase UbiE